MNEEASARPAAGESATSDDQRRLQEASTMVAELRTQIGRRIVGQEELVDGVLAGFLAGGHILLEGVPGLGKTLLVKTLSEVMRLDYSRIQFTPDLMPADVVGTQIVAHDESGGRFFRFQHGPVFTQILLADEINRASPKTQSALLEAMEEGAVTVGREMHPLKEPFVVLATQNPIEMEGTYPLPEAQLDRFMMKLHAQFPSAEQLARIVERNTGRQPQSPVAVCGAEELLRLREFIRAVSMARHVRDYAVRLLLATHPDGEQAPQAVTRYVRHGASPRGLLAMVLVAKAMAVFDGRLNVGFEDLKRSAPLTLTHRLLLNFEGEADGVLAGELVEEVLSTLPQGA